MFEPGDAEFGVRRCGCMGVNEPARYPAGMTSDPNRPEPGRTEAQPPPTSARRGPNLLRWTLAGLPEMDLFETDEQRDAALRGIALEAGNPRAGGWWFGMAILAAWMVVAFVALRLASRLVHWPGIVEELIRIAALLACAVVGLRWLHRSGARRELREKLLAAGVPVCRQCGYSLCGQTPASTKCPECGREIDADARRCIGWRAGGHELRSTLRPGSG